MLVTHEVTSGRLFVPLLRHPSGSDHLESLPAERNETTAPVAWAPLALPHRSPDPALRQVWREVQPVVELPFGSLATPSLTGWRRVAKRSIDVVGSVAALLILSPVFVVVALLIKAESLGPIIFSQRRVGLRGRPFNLLKFRTMRDGADGEKHLLAHLNHTGDPRLFKIPNDPRVTRFGAKLRQWSIDELPQFWNVLMGDMSLVGPRPFFEADLYSYEKHHFERLRVKPGITGLWQVRGRSEVVDFEEVVQLDREYIERWSVWLDVEILALTVPVVVRRRGAY